MPVIVIGADTDIGDAIVTALGPRSREVRAFVSDPHAGAALKERGVKVAIGDVSDASHVGGAALNTFSAVLVPEAASDGRVRSFAAGPAEVYAGWVEALGEAGVRRAIWVGDDDPPAALAAAVAEIGVVGRAGRPLPAVAAEVAHLDAAAAL